MLQISRSKLHCAHSMTILQLKRVANQRWRVPKFRILHAATRPGLQEGLPGEWVGGVGGSKEDRGVGQWVTRARRTHSPLGRGLREGETSTLKPYKQLRPVPGPCRCWLLP